MTASPVPIQNFSIPRGNEQTIFVGIIAFVGDTLDGATVFWRVWPMVFGVAQTQNPPVILKVSGGHGIVIPGSPPLAFDIILERADTLELAFGNYFHEAEVVDAGGNYVTVMNGVMTVTFSGDPQ